MLGFNPESLAPEIIFCAMCFIPDSCSQVDLMLLVENRIKIGRDLKTFTNSSSLN